MTFRDADDLSRATGAHVGGGFFRDANQSPHVNFAIAFIDSRYAEKTASKTRRYQRVPIRIRLEPD